MVLVILIAVNCVLQHRRSLQWYFPSCKNTEVVTKVIIFTPVCLPVHRGRSVLVHPGIPPLGSRHPRSRHTPPGSRHPLPPGADTPSMRYQAVSPHGVRSGLGRQTPFGVPVFAPGWGQSGVNIRAQGVSPCIGIII